MNYEVDFRFGEDWVYDNNGMEEIQQGCLFWKMFS